MAESKETRKSPVALVTPIAVAVAAVVGVVFVLVPQLNPKEKHAGTITEVQIVQYGQRAVDFSVQVHLEGFNGKTCPLFADVRVANMGTPVAGLTDLRVGTFQPESEDDQASLNVSVPAPTNLGQYYVQFEIRDNDGTTVLDSSNSSAFSVTPA